jgi:hypothetical protein
MPIGLSERQMAVCGQWRLGGKVFLRHIKTDGSVAAQFKKRGHCSAEYDELQQTVYLWNVRVGTHYYDAVLQFQDGWRYNLLSAVEDTPYDPAVGTVVAKSITLFRPIISI